MLELSVSEVATVMLALGSPIGVYAAIKADLAETREKAKNAHASAVSAHGRIDVLMNRR
jgi:hypothetical protein